MSHMTKWIKVADIALSETKQMLKETIVEKNKIILNVKENRMIVCKV